MSTKKTEISFEENIKELEKIIAKLEGGEVSLDQMLELFSEGIGRAKECSNQLKNAEQKISVLMKNADGDMEERPFSAE
ncbi:MAG: exodeoxyribonuclease VII small subunit [Clostridia bacterium]|nr:exodeoxyribonuclease VII small subunit [Clostridia bacterium]